MPMFIECQAVPGGPRYRGWLLLALVWEGVQEKLMKISTKLNFLMACRGPYTITISVVVSPFFLACSSSCTRTPLPIDCGLGDIRPTSAYLPLVSAHPLQGVSRDEQKTVSDFSSSSIPIESLDLVNLQKGKEEEIEEGWDWDLPPPAQTRKLIQV